MDNEDRDRVVISINGKFSDLKPLQPGCCIYRVPESLRKVNEDAYRPWVVSIGPFHRDDERLKPMQEVKVRYLESLVKRNKDKNIDDYVKLVRERQQDIRNCYNQQIELDDDTFVEMVLLDAAIIIEILSRFFISEITEKVLIGKTKYLGPLVLRDMMLEENQLPFFVLNDIYNLANPGGIEKGYSFIRVANIFAYMVNSIIQPPGKCVIIDAEINHFVDLLWLWCLASPDGKPGLYQDGCNKTSIAPFDSVTEQQEEGDKLLVSVRENDFTSFHSFAELQERVRCPVSREDDYNIVSIIISIPSVTELQEAGVKFKVSTSENLTDISFNNGALSIPKLGVTDQSETLFRNLLAFEQLHPSRTNYVTGYFAFLDSLINTTKDVDILVKNGIICNALATRKLQSSSIAFVPTFLSIITAFIILVFVMI